MVNDHQHHLIIGKLWTDPADFIWTTFYNHGATTKIGPLHWKQTLEEDSKYLNV